MGTSIYINKESVQIEVVDVYASLPPANVSAGKFYWVETSTGTSWLPGSIGGTYRQAGLYYSNGIDWTHTPVPYQATQAEVNTGVVDDKFVTPLTLTNSDYVLKSGWTIDYTQGKLTETIYAPYNFKINSVTNIFNTPTTTLNINGTPYTLGSNISISDELEVTVDLISVITLNIERI